MSIMVLALLFSDAALNASEVSAYRLAGDSSGGSAEVPARESTRSWKPGIDRWTIEKVDCPAFFKGEIEGFGRFQVGPRCDADGEVPYAL